MTRDEAIAKTRKLLALAQSDNEHEARAAAESAARIMAAHRIEAATLDTHGAAAEPAEDCVEWPDPLEMPDTRDGWPGVLAAGLTKALGCFAWGDGGAVRIVGRASDVQTVRYLHAWGCRTVEQLAGRHRGNGRRWLNAYRVGAAQGIVDAVRKGTQGAAQDARRVATAAGSSALVRVEQALARIDERQAEAERMARAGRNLRAKKTRCTDSGGYGRGHAEGGAAYGQRTQLGGGYRQLGGGRIS